MIGTKNYYSNTSSQISRGMEPWQDLGYSLDIPWNSIWTTGFMDAPFTHADGPVWGEERKMISRSDPEYYASGNIIRSNVIPEINTRDPIYSFDRRKYTIKI